MSPVSPPLPFPCKNGEKHRVKVKRRVKVILDNDVLTIHHGRKSVRRNYSNEAHRSHVFVNSILVATLTTSFASLSAVTAVE